MAADTIKQIHVDIKRCAECGARFGIDAAFCPFDGAALETSSWDRGVDPRAHLVVDDRYEVLEALGEGGMGTVYRVRHTTLNRHFAMKVLRRDLAGDADLATRFLQEARATAAVKHPHVVAITDFGEMTDGVPYFVMELLEGETLATRIRARGPLIPRTALRVAAAIADGLAACHAVNVIHRDLKPENVFLVGQSAGKAAEDEIRIVDFGAAKIMGGSKLTRPGIVFGTPYYMSPEQASGQPIDERADVYSLGVLLYEIVTGHVPFEADSYMGVLTKHIFEAPAKPVVASGVQLGALEEVVMRALEKKPSDRYDSMTSFAAALERAEREASPPRRERPERGTPAHGSMTPSLSRPSTADFIEVSVTRRVEAEARRRHGRTLAGVALAVGAVGTIALLAKLGSAPAKEATAPPAAPGPSQAAFVGTGAPVVRTGSIAPTSPVASGSSTGTPRSRPIEVPSSVEAPPPAPAAPTAPRPRSSATVDVRMTPTGPPTGRTEDFKDPWKH